MCWFICSNAEWSMEGLELRVQIMWNRIVFPSLWFHINRFARKEDIFFYLWCEQFTLYVDFSGCFESETEQSYFSKTNANTFFEGRRTCKMKYHLLYFYHLPKSFTNEGIFARNIFKKNIQIKFHTEAFYYHLTYSFWVSKQNTIGDTISM